MFCVLFFYFLLFVSFLLGAEALRKELPLFGALRCSRTVAQEGGTSHAMADPGRPCGCPWARAFPPRGPIPFPWVGGRGGWLY